ncbi:hypothetical protein DVH24_035974 [Malus domestica]|uniref:Uncharacterized protein n=1 Tax=Malus domestica TaxID=3750 RepID=A0A498JQI3_MALDO|nr:hypothetical protein DVH24_035974 [Malus domestica]
MIGSPQWLSSKDFMSTGFSRKAEQKKSIATPLKSHSSHYLKLQHAKNHIEQLLNQGHCWEFVKSKARKRNPTRGRTKVSPTDLSSLMMSKIGARQISLPLSSIASMEDKRC